MTGEQQICLHFWKNIGRKVWELHPATRISVLGKQKETFEEFEYVKSHLVWQSGKTQDHFHKEQEHSRTIWSADKAARINRSSGLGTRLGTFNLVKRWLRRVTEVSEAISDQRMAVCCPFANKQWDALDKTCWRQGQSKHEHDALDLMCVPVLESAAVPPTRCAFFSPQNPKFLLNPNYYIEI